jgi:hypothetical protein
MKAASPGLPPVRVSHSLRIQQSRLLGVVDMASSPGSAAILETGADVASETAVLCSHDMGSYGCSHCSPFRASKPQYRRRSTARQAAFFSAESTRYQALKAEGKP